MANAVALSHPTDRYEVLMFSDASDNYWGSFLTQVPTAKLEDGIEVEKMSHESVGFLSGTFPGSQQRWGTVDKEGFAIVSTFRRLEYLLWGGVRIYTDHRNLAYIFEPEACVSSVPKTAAQRLENWKMMLAQYDYTIMRISGERNCWGISCLGGSISRRWSCRLSRCSRAVRRMRLCCRRMQFVRYSSRLRLA